MADSTLEHFQELVGILLTTGYPIMPQPHWGQDAAYLGATLDRLHEMLGGAESKETTRVPGLLEKADVEKLLAHFEENACELRCEFPPEEGRRCIGPGDPVCSGVENRVRAALKGE